MTTLLNFLMDRSSSMQSCHKQTVDGFNAYLDEVRKDPDMLLSLVQFDSYGIDKVHSLKPVEAVPAFEMKDLQPRGGTPLIDAAYKFIQAIDVELKLRTDTPKVIVCLQTDGEENQSTEYTWKQLNELVTAKIADGWQFNFMGVEMAAYQQARAMGIPMANTISVTMADSVDNRRKFMSSGSTAMGYSTGIMASTGYTGAMRDAKDKALYDKATQHNAGPAAVVPPPPYVKSPLSQAAALMPRGGSCIPDFTLH